MVGDMIKNKFHQLTWCGGIDLLDMSVEGEVFGKHSHDAFAIGIMEQGVGGNFVRGAKHVFPQNSISLMNPDELHTGFSVAGALKYKMLYVSESAMKNTLGVRNGYYFHTCVAKDRSNLIQKRLAAISFILESPKDHGWKLQVDALLTDVLNLVMRCYAGLATSLDGQEVAAIRQAKDYLDALATTLKNPLGAASNTAVSLEDLAAMVGLHPNYFLNVFKKHVGISPYAYWMTRRMQCAKHLLSTGCASLDVVDQLGFYDQAHFIKTFKRFFGVTPRQLIDH